MATKLTSPCEIHDTIRFHRAGRAGPVKYIPEQHCTEQAGQEFVEFTSISRVLETDDGIHRYLSMEEGGILDKHNDLCMIISRGDADADNYRFK